MGQSSDVAVIGGGVVGLSVARELRRTGVERITLFEKEPSVGRGSSTKANGGIRAQFTTPTNIAFSRYSIEELEDLRRTYRAELSFQQTGYLLFTGDAERAAALEQAAELQRSMGVATEWLEPEEAVHRAPLIRAKGLIGATFHARDGYLDPHGLVATLEQEARRLSVDIRTGQTVEGIARTQHGFDLAVDGDLHAAPWVVNAAGAHAGAIAALLGVDIPVAPLRRNLAYLHDEDAANMPAAMPMCVDLDSGVLVRREGPDGYVIAYSDPEDLPGWDDALDDRFLPSVAERIGKRFPELEGKPIHPKHCWAGLYPETPDGHAIVGAAPSVPGFIQCVGFGGHGLMHAPAAGKAVAELITDGRCSTFDLHPLRPSRFDEGDVVVETAVL